MRVSPSVRRFVVDCVKYILAIDALIFALLLVQLWWPSGLIMLAGLIFAGVVVDRRRARRS
jgi:hypothetical protein